ncbi:MAG: choice-of-anchor D domain-containing protein [Acidobacteria bacterium]|nr:choice-of-anchor D domain-containing protein [Acidobacteriota bacterium]
MSSSSTRCFRTISQAVFCLAVFATSVFGQSTMRVIRESKHDVSLPLAELGRMTPAQPNPFSPRLLKVLPTKPVLAAPQYEVADAALQEQMLTPMAATIGLNFEGLGQSQYGFVVQAAPPDTNGAVGATQYVQWVNLEYAVFDKATGALTAGPFQGNSIWAGFGGQCQTSNDGDPIVQYDKIANRWILTQFAVSSTPYLQCVAVSTTSDATGSYNRYAFSFGNSFPDYPKLGVWPDAYYISFNMFGPVNFLGADACAMDRNKMLAGLPATIVCFQQNTGVDSLLPSDMDGLIQPAQGEPAFFADFGTNSLRLWKFHVDFATPANSTFTGPTTLAVANFNPLCGGGTCVSQPGTTQKLDSLADRLMYRLAYRKFTDGHEALVANHAITTGTRWYEIRNPNGTPSVFQQGTYAPDSSTRWMGSIAMDQSGDIALGYSVASGSVFPSIAFTGRFAGDALGTMQAEQSIVAGTGSQTNLVRWGDYSAMTVDPVDDCTFWYTQEYIKATGSFNWNTRIANFKFDTCGGSGGGGTAILSTTLLKFAKTPIGQSSAPLSVTLSNTGTGPLNLFSVTASGDYQISNNTCSTTVDAGTSCIVSVTFTPTKKNARTGTLTFSDDAPNSPQTVTLKGTGQSLALSPTALNFGTLTVGNTSSPQDVTVTNVGSTAVTFTGFAFAGGAAGDYLIAGNTCGTTIAPGATCAVSVGFKPTKKGARNAKLNIKNNGGGSPSTATVTGIGN